MSDVTYELRDRELADEGDLFPPRRESYSATAECVIPLVEGIPSLDALFPRPPAGASHETLVRRMRYGGRKGRSAQRRLLERGLPVTMKTGPMTFRGKAVVLDEAGLFVRMRGSRS